MFDSSDEILTYRRYPPALDVILLLEKLGAKVSFSDPFIPSIKLDGRDMQGVELLGAAAAADCVVIVTDHTTFDYKALLDASKLIVDTRNAMKTFKSPKIVRL